MGPCYFSLVLTSFYNYNYKILQLQLLPQLQLQLQHYNYDYTTTTTIYYNWFGPAIVSIHFMEETQSWESSCTKPMVFQTNELLWIRAVVSEAFLSSQKFVRRKVKHLPRFFCIDKLQSFHSIPSQPCLMTDWRSKSFSPYPIHRNDSQKNHGSNLLTNYGAHLAMHEHCNEENDDQQLCG